MILPIQFNRCYEPLLPELKKAFEEFIIQGHYIGGPLIDSFEVQMAQFIGAAYAVGCKSGTHSLWLALKACQIGSNDEVITVANTYYATVEAIRSAGAKPIFCDINPDTGLIAPEKISDLITPATRAILPVHLYGYPAPMEEICAIAKEHNLFVIEDCAHAFGTKTKGRYIGAGSFLACYSFYPTKNIGAFGDGGMVITQDEKMASRLRDLRYFADNTRTIFEPDALHARLDPIQARLLVVLLEHFGETMEKRKVFAGIYQEMFKDIPNLRYFHQQIHDEVTHYVFPILTPYRTELLDYLKNHDIHVQVHYPINLHHLPQFGGSLDIVLPYTEQHNAQVVSLSVHPSLEDEEIEMIAHHVSLFHKNKTNL